METKVQIQKSDARTKILQRVLNLRALAENSAASEAEVNTAITMAMKLMNSYNIEEAELALAEASGEIKLDVITKNISSTIFKGSKQKHKIVNCLPAIQKFTETRCVFDIYTGAIIFTGHRPDVELADFLVAVIKEALDREYNNYRTSNPVVGYGAKTAFQHAMASRISHRLFEMAKQRDKEREYNKKEAKRMMIENSATASSTALVIADIANQKAKMVSEEFSKAHPIIRKFSKTLTRIDNVNAFSAGRAAGDKVNLGRAINQTSKKAITS
jgi:hypothetical protein